ncbi:MAG TPA: DNA-3-methyladenine glycosylase 2 family protein [Alphaproteobacteria bacterium]|nr:DNA-3-methyladenine glycosylase 2 family protein [Alphaproteobacteria bacterium]
MRSTALEALAERDPDLAAALAAIGPPPPRERPPGFASLLRAIVAQQVSAASAAALWTRLAGAIDPLVPEAVAQLDTDALRKLGLSRQKAFYAQGLARDILDRRVDLDLIHTLDDEAAISHLIQIKGIGRWSAEVYLLFALGRPDVFPAGDLALAIAMQRLKRLRRRPDPKRLAKLAEPWRPYRGAAAQFLWHYYKAPPV